MKFAAPLAAVFAIFLAADVAVAQLPAARLTTVFPPGAQQGTSVEVTVGGIDLDDLTALRFTSPGISAEPKIDAATGKPVANVFTVHVGADVRPGAYDVRAVGRFGVTNPRAFVVDSGPHTTAKAGNTSPEAAVEVAVNSGSFATAVANSAQFFKVNLKANRLTFVEVDGVELDSRLEPVLVAVDAAGREVARSAGGESTLALTPPADGAYVIKVHDVLYRGGGEYFYRLRVSDGPRVDFLLPPAFRQDELSDVQLHARSAGPSSFRLLDPLGETGAADLRTSWYLPPAAGMLDGVQRYGFAGASGPLFLGRAAAPLVAEQPDNDHPTKAQKITPPVETFGQFFPRNDRDWFSFDAKKGETFWVEVIANRLLGALTDPVVLVQRVTKNDKGEEQLVDVKECYEPENIPNMPREFYAAHRDPAFAFAAPEDGTYRVLVRDLFNTNSDDPRRVYRLSIVPVAQKQDFRLVAWPQAPQPLIMNPPTTQSWGSNIRPGGVMPVSVLAFRTGAFNGEITLSAENLPAGVTCKPVTMHAGANAETLMLVADEKAPPGVASIRIVGTASTPAGSRLSRTARAGTVVWTVPNQELEPLRSRVAQEFVIAVTAGEVDPIAVAPAEQKVWENSLAGTIEIPLKVTRRGATFAGVVKLKPGGAGDPLLGLPEFDVAAGATDARLVIDVGARALPVGSHSVYLQATSVGSYDRYPVQFAAAKAAKESADKATAELATAVTKAKEAVAAAKTPEEKTAAEKAVAAAEEKVKQNEAAKAAAAEQIKNLTPKDATAYAYSPAIALKITASPITLTAAPLPGPIKPGAKVEIPVTITRLYGFADVVELSLTAPQGVPGLTAANVTIPADKTQATLVLQAAPDAKPGDYAFTLTANLKQNTRPVKHSESLAVKVIAP